MKPTSADIAAQVAAFQAGGGVIEKPGPRRDVARPMADARGKNRLQWVTQPPELSPFCRRGNGKR